jgi:hypothetical protein
MRFLLSAILIGRIAGFWLLLEYWQAKKLYTRDLSNGGIEEPFRDKLK